MSSQDKAPFQLFHLDTSDQGIVLERALKKRLEGASWGEIRESIRRRKVQVNGNLCLDPVRKVTAKDVVKLWRESLPKPIEASDIRIVHVDDFLVVVEKPAGITSVRHFEERNLPDKRRQLQPTLEELLPLSLLQYFLRNSRGERQSKKLPNSPSELKDWRPEDRKSLELKLEKLKVIAVHRLDRDTSGLMLFARTQGVARSLIEAFKHHRVLRKYHAVVHGYPEAQSIDTILVRNRGDGHRGTKPKSDASPKTDAKPVVDVSSIVDSSSAMDGKSAVDTESINTESGDTESSYTESGGGGKQADPTEQRAITHIRPIEKIGPYSLIECQLETGRTHQIRIHLSEAGHLLCGDAIYCKLADGRLVQDQSGAPRQALHSATLSFQHPISEEKLEFKMPWPADLHRWLSSLRQIHSKQ